MSEKRAGAMNCRILCVGDSNTYGFDPRGFGGGRYAQPWTEILAEQTGYEVVNEGLNGREFPGNPRQIENMNRLMAALMPANLLVILLGTNDLMNIQQSVTQELERRMDQWFRSLRELWPKQKILLVTPPECPALECWDPGMWAEALPIYRRMAEKYGMELEECTPRELDLAYDEVHLSEEGHKKMAEKLRHRIESLGF